MVFECEKSSSPQLIFTKHSNLIGAFGFQIQHICMSVGLFELGKVYRRLWRSFFPPPHLCLLNHTVGGLEVVKKTIITAFYIALRSTRPLVYV